MSLKLESLANAVTNVASLAKSTVEAHAKAAAADAARIVAEAARDAAHAARATAEAVVVSAQNDIDKLVAELEAAIGVTVTSITPAAVAPEVPVVAAAVVPAAVSPEVAALNAAVLVAPAAPVAPVAPAADPVAPAEVHGLAAVSAALGHLFSQPGPAPVANQFPPFDPRSKALPVTPNAPK